MLERLMAFGISKNFFDVMPLGELEKSCCSNSKIEVIDYDKTKELVSSIAKIQQPKSADALKILPDLNRIDFIELKGFVKHIHHERLHGQIFAPAISAFTTSLSIMQEVRSHGWRKVESRLEQRSRATQGAVAETQRARRKTKVKKLAIRKHPVGMKPKIRKGFVSPP